MSQHLISLALILSLLSGPVIPSALAQEAEVWTEVLRIGRGGVTDIAWSPTGEVIAVATELGTWLYTPELETIRFLEGAYNIDNTVAWSPDGKMLASSGPEGIPSIWDATTGEVMATVDDWAHSWTWSLDSSTLLYTGTPGDPTTSEFRDMAIKTWNVQDPHTGEIPVVMEVNSWPKSWSPDGSRIAGATSCRTGSGGPCELSIWDTGTGEHWISVEPKGREVYDLAWSPSGMLIAAGHEVFGSGPGYAYPMVQIWDTISGQLLLTPTSAPDFYDEIHALAWSTDSRLAGGSLEGILYIWQLTIKSGEEATWETLATLEGHEGTITAAAWSPDGTRLVSASEDGRVRIWDVECGDAVATLESHAQDFEEIVWSPDGKQLLSSSWNGEIWDAVTGEQLTLVRGFRRVGGRNWSIAWSVNGPYLADRDDDVIRVQNVSTGEALARFEMKNYSIYHIALSPNGTFLMGEDTRRDVCVIWDVSSGERIAILNSGEWWLEKLTWSWDETRIAGGHGDGQVFIWDVQNGERLATLHADDDRVWAIAWSPDDRYLATSGLRDSIIRIWDTVSWEEVASFGRFSFFLAWSPDGTRLIASAGNDGMRLWDTRSWEQVAVLEGHQSEIQSVAWSPDGTRIASASWDGTIRVWERQ